jgi:hypothetical protein
VYDGEFYVAWSAKLPVVRGEPLGQGEYPPCDDGGGCDDEATDADGRPTRVWSLPGADPAQVIVARTEGSRQLVVLGRMQADPDDYFRFSHGEWHFKAAYR